MSNMFVHSGASLHRHEYSPPVERRNSIPSRSYLAQAAFPPTVRRSSTISDKPIPIIRRPEQSLSDFSLRAHEHTVRFQELDLGVMDVEDSKSVANSDSSEATRTSRHGRRTSKAVSSFKFAYPAPTQLRQQRLLKIRPKMLLQLQHLPPGSRPMPVIDVLTSMVVVPRVIKKFPRMFKGKGELGANDVMVVKSEAYDMPDADPNAATDSDEESLSSRELLAVICQARKDEGGSAGRAEIVLADGSLWMANPLPKDSFEFITIDDAGNKTTARWARKSNKKKGFDLSEAVDGSQEPQYSFSIMDPSTRRHPIIATLSPNNLRVHDYYAPITSPSGSSVPTSPIRRTPADSEQSAGRSASFERILIQVDERMRVLIQVTGIWVGLRKNWCPFFKYNDILTTPNSSTRSRVASSPTGRPESILIAQNGPSSPLNGSGTLEPITSPLTVVGNTVKRSYTMACPQMASRPSEAQSLNPHRTVSTGSAFMQRAAARRGHSYPSVADANEDDHFQSPVRHTGTDLNGGITATTAKASPSGFHILAPDTPTKPQRRPHSTILPANGSLNGKSLQEKQDVNLLVRKGSADAGKKRKISRWKSIANLFKRGPRSS